MKTYRVVIQQEFSWAATRVQAGDSMVAVAKAVARLYDREDGQITKVTVEEVG